MSRGLPSSLCLDSNVGFHFFPPNQIPFLRTKVRLISLDPIHRSAANSDVLAGGRLVKHSTHQHELHALKPFSGDKGSQLNLDISAQLGLISRKGSTIHALIRMLMQIDSSESPAFFICSVVISTSILLYFQSSDYSLSQEKDKIRRTGRVLALSVGSDGVLIPTFPINQESSPAPFVSALKSSAELNVASFHFPGHNRGHAAPSSLTKVIGLKPYLHDLPELPELGNLFSPHGPILEAQKQAAKLFGASETWFLVGGTTCGIQASIMATCSPGEFLILPRNSHLSAISALVLSGALPKYIIPDYDFDWDIAGGVTPSQVEKAIMELENEGHKAAAVFVTSPTYHGICSDLREICKLCHSRKIPVIVDEAHGAHLGFHSRLPCSALQQGADLAVQSTHKVLSSLTQASMLHMSGEIVKREQIGRCLQTLQTTSPSNLLLASLDAATAQLGEDPETIFDQAIELAYETKSLLKNISGISVLERLSFPVYPNIDPLRLTVGFWRLGLSGNEADEILYRDDKILCELVGSQSMTFAFNLGTCSDHVQRLVSGIKHLSSTYSQIHQPARKMEASASALLTDMKMILNPREAFFACKKRVTLRESIGKVSGELICPYPPGIPLLIPGEVITERSLSYLLRAKMNGADISGASDQSLSSIDICVSC